MQHERVLRQKQKACTLRGGAFGLHQCRLEFGGILVAWIDLEAGNPRNDTTPAAGSPARTGSGSPRSVRASSGSATLPPNSSTMRQARSTSDALSGANTPLER
jgi:hypothetical protein